jgi:hypothetical protein
MLDKTFRVLTQGVVAMQEEAAVGSIQELPRIGFLGNPSWRLGVFLATEGLVHKNRVQILYSLPFPKES